MLAIGILGVILCVASVMLFGLDITHLVTDGTFAITDIATVIQLHAPGLWQGIVVWAQNQPPGDIFVRVAGLVTALPASLIGLLLGAALVIIGFRIKRG